MTLFCRQVGTRQNAAPPGGSDDTPVLSVGAI